ncbi:hypothetical protein FOCC_FOCC003524 [Frankliniella occidentalis]|nr:hypothetical protein FOCC_FOCC003524 [Frankliniella occidentalis]
MEVTGVSRSGRVRKKSSKLMDFESPDEIDYRVKRTSKADTMSPAPSRGPGPAKKTPKSQTPAHSFSRPMPPPQQIHQPEPDLSDDDDARFGVKLEQGSSESESDSEMFPAPEGVECDFSSEDSLGSEDDLDEDPLMDERHVPSHQGFQRIDAVEPPPAQSTYMMEKSSKKKLIIRDGKIVGRMKAQRKDKGKTRFTAYMLWAKEKRQDLTRKHPDMDFAQMSKRLGELWATVPYNEKYAWKRRAERLANKGAGAKGAAGTGAGTMEHPNMKRTKPPPPAKSKFINKGSTRETPTKQQNARGSHSNSAASLSALSISPPDRGGKGLVSEPVIGPGMYKVVGTQPVDVAAHLKLLGESLSIIGERLKEHEGQIAVSGSLSVLLDSLLCVLGPLLCLTSQVPETNVCSQDMLSKLLDNTAYIMPGL